MHMTWPQDGYPGSTPYRRGHDLSAVGPWYYVPADLAEVCKGACNAPHFSQALSEITHRPMWHAAMGRCAQDTLSAPAGAWTLALGRAAAALGCWAVARALLWHASRVMADAAPALLELARVSARTGGTREALHLLRHPALASLPAAADLRETLSQRYRRWCQLAWYQPQVIGQGALSLEPIGPEHCQEVLRCHRDVQLAQLAGFPQFNTPQRYAQWLEEERARPGALHLAVMHRDEGFVGLVGGIRLGETASFHFWIHAGLRGQGLGPLAAQLMFARLRALGVRVVVTVVLAHNDRSLRAMQRMGLQRLPLRALEPFVQMVPFAMTLGPEAMGMAEQSWRLIELFKAVKSPVHFE
jgi:RimJ/RimL family protein N-acetyltransferase